MMKEIQENYAKTMPSEHQIMTDLNTAESEKIDLDLYFEKGLIGFSEHVQYRLTHFQNEIYSPLKMLINLETPALSLLLVDVNDLDDTMIKSEDLLEAPFQYLQNQSHIGCYLILTINKPGSDLLFTANIRAPIFVDYQQRRALQYILSPQYEYTYPLKELSQQIRQRRAMMRESIEKF